MTDIVMPRLSDTMEEGTILRWLKRDGEHIRRGEELVEIETDKANMTYESDRDGVLQTVAREGDTLAVGELIAHIGERSSRAEEPADAGAGASEPAAAGAGASELPAGTSVGSTPSSAHDRAEASHDGSPAPASNGHPPERPGRVKASPLARRMARESGVDLRSLAGSGPGGRIVKADVQALLTGATADATAAVPALAAAPPGGGAHAATPPPAPIATARPSAAGAPSVGELGGAKGETTGVELSRTQRTIARRMAESKATIPHFTLSSEVDMQRCVELRNELKRLSHNDAPTYNDMVVKACALALHDHPRANGSYRDGRFELHSRVNVGVAVAVDAQDPLHSALVVPTIFDADSKSLGEVARETRTLAQRVRGGTITPPELSGATFTVSNLGMYGVSSFSAIVNPPQAAILAVGAVQPRAVVHDGEIVARHVMSVTLSCDHRILYGADAALFLGRVRELLEEPAALTL
jgi:pyruvate dehydrogenase E2 component (dihydrolipoamide acetyltransferase)